MIALLCDPTIEEERVLDGKLIYSMNAHKELCSIHKPGKESLPLDVIIKATQLASHRIQSLHKQLQTVLFDVENKVTQERIQLLEQMRRFQQHNQQLQRNKQGENMDIDHSSFGISRDDPVLSWSHLHKPAISE